MVSFCIDSSVLGTEKHLVCADTGYSWRRTIPPDTWHLSNKIKRASDWCLDSLLRLGKVDINLLPPKKFITAMSFLTKEIDLPWQKIMPPEAHRTFVECIIKQVSGVIDTLPIDYYRDTWVPGYRVIRSLKRAKIDIKRYNEILATNPGNIAALETFKPQPDGYARTIKYDRFGTLTGRLTVSSGPNIMILKRDYRDILAPSEPGGQIMYVDFAALEVRIILYEAGKYCDANDLYEMIAKDIDAPRNAVKAAVISMLYGSSNQALEKVLCDMNKDEIKTFLKRVKMYFNTSELMSRIKTQFMSTGNVINRYGRKVLIDEPLNHVFINYYAQSSGADVALLGFSQLVDMLVEKRVKPLFLLHDALILDVPRDAIQFVKNINHVRVKGYVQKFVLKVDEIACTSRHVQHKVEHVANA